MRLIAIRALEVIPINAVVGLKVTKDWLDRQTQPEQLCLLLADPCVHTRWGFFRDQLIRNAKALTYQITVQTIA